MDTSFSIVSFLASSSHDETFVKGNRWYWGGAIVESVLRPLFLHQKLIMETKLPHVYVYRMHNCMASRYCVHHSLVVYLGHGTIHPAYEYTGSFIFSLQNVM